MISSTGEGGSKSNLWQIPDECEWEKENIKHEKKKVVKERDGKSVWKGVGGENFEKERM